MSASADKCEECGADVALDAAECSECGAPSSISVTPISVSLTCETYPPSLVKEGRAAGTNDTIVEVSDPAGTESKSTRTSDGLIELNIRGVGNIGRPGEARLFKTFRQALAKVDKTVTIHPARDDWGEDGMLCHDGVKYSVQIVTVPTDSKFWGAAARGCARRQADVSTAAKWIHEAIRGKASKTSQTELRKPILALDASHVHIVFDDVVEHYLTLFEDPHREFEFASVWIVGPTTSYCCRIGGGAP